MRATSLGHAGILIETRHGSIVCDPWFVPAFFGSWFVFPRNDRLAPELLAKVEQPDFLYVSHLHGDHLDEAFLADHIDRSTTVLLPDYPTRELERRLRGLGFTRVRPHRARHAHRGRRRSHHRDPRRDVDHRRSRGRLGADRRRRREPPARPERLPAPRPRRADRQRADRPAVAAVLGRHLVPDGLRHARRATCRSSSRPRSSRSSPGPSATCRRSAPRVVVPSAGPPCFLDPELLRPQRHHRRRAVDLPRRHRLPRPARGGGHRHRPDRRSRARPSRPATVGSSSTTRCPTTRSSGSSPTRRPTWRATPPTGSRGWRPSRVGWHAPTPDLLATLQAWWEPLLASAPTLRAGHRRRRAPPARGRRGARRARRLPGRGGAGVDAASPSGSRSTSTAASSRPSWPRGPSTGRTRCSCRCRFRAWRAGEFNEFLYNFFKSLSPERMARTEAEAAAKRGPARRRDRCRQRGRGGPARRRGSSSATAPTGGPTWPPSGASTAACSPASCTAGSSTSRPGAASPPTTARSGSAGARRRRPVR